MKKEKTEQSMEDRGTCCHLKQPDHGGDQDLSFMEAARFEIRRKERRERAMWISGEGASQAQGTQNKFTLRINKGSEGNEGEMMGNLPE